LPSKREVESLKQRIQELTAELESKDKNEQSEDWIKLVANTAIPLVVLF